MLGKFQSEYFKFATGRKGRESRRVIGLFLFFKMETMPTRHSRRSIPFSDPRNKPKQLSSQNDDDNHCRRLIINNTKEKKENNNGSKTNSKSETSPTPLVKNYDETMPKHETMPKQRPPSSSAESATLLGGDVTTKNTDSNSDNEKKKENAQNVENEGKDGRRRRRRMKIIQCTTTSGCT
jgi:hypothetical protein